MAALQNARPHDCRSQGTRGECFGFPSMDKEERVKKERNRRNLRTILARRLQEYYRRICQEPSAKIRTLMERLTGHKK
jgi:hypothetical protein